MQVITFHQPTALGAMAVQVNSSGEITQLVFTMDAALDLKAPPTSLAADIGQRLGSYFDGDLNALDALRLNPHGTPWQHRVWGALRQLRPGEVVSYGELARKMGLDGSRMARAVGCANRANPIAVAIPCHRVIAQNGELQGYAWGLSKKAWLLEHEKSAAVQRSKG